MKKSIILLILTIIFGTLSTIAQDYTTQELVTLKQKAQEGYPDAQYELGVYYYNTAVSLQDGNLLWWLSQGANEIESNFKMAFEWFSQAAIRSHTEAQYYTGYMFRKGIGTKKNIKSAIAWYTNAANNGNLAAMRDLGEIYYDGKDVEQDYSVALQWYLKYINTLDYDNPWVYEKIGNIYYHQANYATAMKYYSKAISSISIYDSYYSDLYIRVADCYFEGKGVTQDYSIAIEYYDGACGDMFEQFYDLLYFECGYDPEYDEVQAELNMNKDYIYANKRIEEAKQKLEEQRLAEAEAKARAEAEARAKAEAEALARDRARHPLRYFIKDSKEAWKDFKEDAAYWLFDDIHDFENYIFAEATMSLSDKLSTMVGANLDLYFNDRGRLGLHSSINFMDNGSWGFRLGPVLRLNQSWDNIEWQLYGGIGPHWAINAPLDTPYTETCHLSGDVGIRANFHKLSEDSILSYSSLSVGCQMMMGKAVPVVGVSLWPALLFSNISLSSNYTTLAGETMVAFGDGFLMGASLSWTPTTLGWYGTILAPIDAAGMTITTGPVFSMLDGMFQVYGGMGLVDDEFGGDLGVRLVSDYSYSIGFQFSSTAFLTLGIGLEF